MSEWQKPLYEWRSTDPEQPMKLERNDSKESPMTPQEEIEKIVKEWSDIQTDDLWEIFQGSFTGRDALTLATRAYTQGHTAGQQSRDARVLALENDRDSWMGSYSLISEREQGYLARIAELEAQLKAVKTSDVIG